MFHEDDRSKASGDQPSLHIPLSGIPVIQVVAGPRVRTSTDEGFALALTDTGVVYSWGRGYRGEVWGWEHVASCVHVYCSD